jgi:prepilin-type N-terminal cleavage/methylation domain-containing protein
MGNLPKIILIWYYCIGFYDGDETMGMLFTKDKKGYSCKVFFVPVFRKFKFRLNNGFSLVEIMAVIVILGALTALAIPVFSSNNDNASSVVCKTNQYHLRVAEEAYVLMYGTHTDEYLLGRQLNDNSPIHKFFIGDESIVCPVSGEHYYWAMRGGIMMLFCPTHGTDNPPVIEKSPSVPIITEIYEELMQNYPDSKILRLVFSPNVQKATKNADAVLGTEQKDIVQGNGGNDLIDGGGGDDNLRGNNGDDGIFGGEGDDYINGGGGNDTLAGGTGNDWILGGNGSDIAVYDKPMDAYDIQKLSKTKVTVTDIETEEKDTLEKVEIIRFGDGEEIIVKELEIID